MTGIYIDHLKILISNNPLYLAYTLIIFRIKYYTLSYFIQQLSLMLVNSKYIEAIDLSPPSTIGALHYQL